MRVSKLEVTVELENRKEIIFDIQKELIGDGSHTIMSCKKDYSGIIPQSDIEAAARLIKPYFDNI